jgi:hypothetical protein
MVAALRAPTITSRLSKEAAAWQRRAVMCPGKVRAAEAYLRMPQPLVGSVTHRYDRRHQIDPCEQQAMSFLCVSFRAWHAAAGIVAAVWSSLAAALVDSGVGGKEPVSGPSSESGLRADNAPYPLDPPIQDSVIASIHLYSTTIVRLSRFPDRCRAVSW